MAKYYECPTSNCECPYWDWKRHKCAMEVMDGDSPAGQCDEYDTYNDDDDISDEELEAAAEEAHDELVRSLVEAGGEIREAKALLARSLEMLYLLGYDSSFTNPAIDALTSDIKEFLEERN